MQIQIDAQMLYWIAAISIAILGPLYSLIIKILVKVTRIGTLQSANFDAQQKINDRQSEELTRIKNIVFTKEHAENIIALACADCKNKIAENTRTIQEVQALTHVLNNKLQ